MSRNASGSSGLHTPVQPMDLLRCGMSAACMRAGHRNGVRRGGDDREVEDVEGDERLL